MSPVAELISQGLNAAVEMWVTQGYVDLESLAEDFDPVAERARAMLVGTLDREQMEEFEVFLENLDEEAVDAAWTALVGRVAEALGLDRKQMDQLCPVLRSISGTAGRTFEPHFKQARQIGRGLQDWLRCPSDRDTKDVAGRTRCKSDENIYRTSG